MVLKQRFPRPLPPLMTARLRKDDARLAHERQAIKTSFDSEPADLTWRATVDG